MDSSYLQAIYMGRTQPTINREVHIIYFKSSELRSQISKRMFWKVLLFAEFYKTIIQDEKLGPDITKILFNFYAKFSDIYYILYLILYFVSEEELRAAAYLEWSVGPEQVGLLMEFTPSKLSQPELLSSSSVCPTTSLSWEDRVLARELQVQPEIFSISKYFPDQNIFSSK